MSLLPGRPWPLGAHWDGGGVNVAVFSAHAQRIELCLFDDSGEHELSRQRLPAHSRDVFHGYLPGAGPGRVYGLQTPAFVALVQFSFSLGIGTDAHFTHAG